MFTLICELIEVEFIGEKEDEDKEALKWQRTLNNLEICNMKYVDNYITEFEKYYYKIGENSTNLQMFFDKLPAPINEQISEEYRELIKNGDKDTLGNKISYVRKCVEKKCRDVRSTQRMKKQFLTCWETPDERVSRPNKFIVKTPL